MFNRWAVDVRRMRVCKEVGEGGTPHLHITCTFKTAKRLTAMKKLHPKVHWEEPLTEDSPWLYVSKYGSEVIIDVDNRKRKGERTDLKQIAKKSRKEIMEEYPEIYMRYHAGIDKLEAAKPAPWRRDLKVYYFWGPTHSGKTATVFEEHPEVERCVLSGPPSQPFVNGYRGGKVVLFDDVRKSNADLNWWLGILDIYPIPVKSYGSSVPWCAEVIYITASMPPADFWFPIVEDVGQFIRRCTVIREFNKVETHAEPVTVTEEE